MHQRAQMTSRELAIDLVASMLRERTGQCLTPDRYWRVESALSSLLRERGIDAENNLTLLLTQPEKSELVDELVEALLNNETYFFRDRALFDTLDKTILPELARRRESRRRLSIWSAGCSSGQEALSLAMLFDQQAQRWEGWQIEIVGSDISARMIATARKGVYTPFAVQRGLSVMQMMRYFTEVDGGWQASPALLSRVRYEVGALHALPPYPGRFDLILCRNVLIYFDDEARRNTLLRLADSLSEDGRLMLGCGEQAKDAGDRLVPSGEATGYFRRTSMPGLASPAGA